MGLFVWSCSPRRASEGGRRRLGNGPWAHFLFGFESALKRAIDKQSLIALLEPALQALGYELVDLDVRSGRGALLRLYIDREPTVTLSDCEFVSQQIGALLDVEDPLPGSYTLEVSSPGLDRRLRTPEHFQRFVDCLVKVELKRGVEGRRRFQGRLVSIADDELTLAVDGQDWCLPLDDVAQARLVPED